MDIPREPFWQGKLLNNSVDILKEHPISRFLYEIREELLVIVPVQEVLATGGASMKYCGSKIFTWSEQYILAMPCLGKTRQLLDNVFKSSLSLVL